MNHSPGLSIPYEMTHHYKVKFGIFKQIFLNSLDCFRHQALSPVILTQYITDGTALQTVQFRKCFLFVELYAQRTDDFTI